MGCRAEERGVAQPDPAARGHVIPICHEVGGRQGVLASALLDKTCISAGGALSDRTTFKVYALQRLHAATFRGVAAVTNAHLAHGPRGLPWAGCIAAGPCPAKADHQLFISRVLRAPCPY